MGVVRPFYDALGSLRFFHPMLRDTRGLLPRPLYVYGLRQLTQLLKARGTLSLSLCKYIKKISFAHQDSPAMFHVTEWKTYIEK